jgi:hypothetical protein
VEAILNLKANPERLPRIYTHLAHWSHCPLSTAPALLMSPLQTVRILYEEHQG